MGVIWRESFYKLFLKEVAKGSLGDPPAEKEAKMEKFVLLLLLPTGNMLFQ